MRITVSQIILLILLIIPAAMYGADEKKAPQTLEALADDLKYQNGIEFMKLKMYGKALETFNEYLEIYYNGTHRHEAYKHIAEIHFSRQEYLKAIENFHKLYEEFNHNDSGVEAYYNIGICYNKMGYDKKAAEIFNDILENHSDSAYAQQAKLQLDMLNILTE